MINIDLFSFRICIEKSATLFWCPKVQRPHREVVGFVRTIKVDYCYETEDGIVGNGLDGSPTILELE